MSLVEIGHPDQSSLHTHRPWTPPPALWWPGQDATLDSGKTLVIYVYFEDPWKKGNMEFFLDVGMQERDDIDYVVVVQGNSTIQFPEWRNLVVLRKENDCYDFGGWRYALDHIPWREKAYRYFIFLNSSLRGPFVPLYVPPSIHWTTLFTQLLKHDGDGFTSTNNGPIKLVGLTINCYSNCPHVQSMFWATDFETVDHLITNTSVLSCKHFYMEAVKEGELKLSASILARGWNIASLAIATRGWDFRKGPINCNNGEDPTVDGHYYGSAPAIHETIFSKTNRRARDQEISVYSAMLMVSLMSLMGLLLVLVNLLLLCLRSWVKSVVQWMEGGT